MQKCWTQSRFGAQTSSKIPTGPSQETAIQAQAATPSPSQSRGTKDARVWVAPKRVHLKTVWSCPPSLTSIPSAQQGLDSSKTPCPLTKSPILHRWDLLQSKGASPLQADKRKGTRVKPGRKLLLPMICHFCTQKINENMFQCQCLFSIIKALPAWCTYTTSWRRCGEKATLLPWW